jgi:hypothetical protein
MGDKIWPDFPPQVDDAVMNRNGARITGLETFHVVRHQEGKWHNVVLRSLNLGRDYARRNRSQSIRFFRSNSEVGDGYQSQNFGFKQSALSVGWQSCEKGVLGVTRPHYLDPLGKTFFVTQ